jgi:hypothetical protein
VPKKNPISLFQRLSKLRGRVKRIKNEVSRLAGIASSKDLKFQLRNARDALAEADDMMTPAPDHEDQPLRVSLSEGATATAKR